MKPPRNPAYLAFVRSLPSIVSGIEEQSLAHHVRMGGNGGVGRKPSDYLTLPLTSTEHIALHNRGERSYWTGNGVDPFEAILATMRLYARERNVYLPEPVWPVRETIDLYEKLLEEARG